MKIDKVIFDIGKVLVKFDPKNLYKKIFDSNDQIDFFFKNICPWNWHIQQDLVYDTTKATLEKIKEYPNYKEAIESFYGRFVEMIAGVYEENLKIAMDLKSKGIPVYILSNFPGAQFDEYMSNNPFLKEFNDIIISGKVGLKKPDPKIYELCIKQFDCIPEKTLFIDDRLENTKAANKLGFQTITLDNPFHLSEYIKKFTF